MKFTVKWGSSLKDKGLEKAISGHYFSRMFCIILLFTTAAIFAQMIMGNKGIQMEIEYMVEEDRKDVEQILEKYSSMLEISSEYISRLSEQERGEYFTAVCAACGGEAKLPFEPKSDRPVYCSDCFAKMREQA